jgi:F0F1-type ATP synthase membrane subunit b/b'
VLIGFFLVYSFVSRIAAPRIEETLESRRSHIDDLVKAADKLSAEASGLETDATVMLENAELALAATEKDLVSSFRQRSIHQKESLFALFAHKTKEDAVELSRSADQAFQEVSRDLDALVELAMNSVACPLKKR